MAFPNFLCFLAEALGAAWVLKQTRRWGARAPKHALYTGLAGWGADSGGSMFDEHRLLGLREKREPFGLVIRQSPFLGLGWEEASDVWMPWGWATLRQGQSFCVPTPERCDKSSTRLPFTNFPRSGAWFPCFSSSKLCFFQSLDWPGKGLNSLEGLARWRSG